MSGFGEGAALIVGASGGIGSAIARAFAAAGSTVAATYRSNAEAAGALADELRSNGAAVETYCVDVTERSTVDAAVAGAIARFGRLHSVVFVAGLMPTQRYIADFADDEWRQAIEVETHGFYTVTRAVLSHLRERGGSIVHLGSAGDVAWMPRDGLSVVPKAANEALVRGIAREEGRHGIRANSVLVGVVETGMFLKFKEQGVFDDAWADSVKRGLPLRRFARAEEVADAVVFLASDRAGYITGQQLAVAGGYGV